jgi:hypothetical protein
MKRLFPLLFILTFSLTGCLDDLRIDLISEHSGIKLPPSYEVLKNESSEKGFMGRQYEINIQLQFDAENFGLLMLTLPNDSSWRQEGVDYIYQHPIGKVESEEAIIDTVKRRLYYSRWSL